MRLFYKLFLFLSFAAVLTTTYARFSNNGIWWVDASDDTFFHYVSISPESGKVAQLPDSIVVTFEDNIGKLDIQTIGLLRDGKPAGSVTSTIHPADDTKVIFFINYKKGKEAGTYTLTVPAGTIYNDWEDVPEFYKSNGEISISYTYEIAEEGSDTDDGEDTPGEGEDTPGDGDDTPIEDSDIMLSAKDLLKVSGVGYPSETSQARLALMSAVNSDPVVDDNTLLSLMSDFYLESDVTLPSVDGWYYISVVNQSGDKLYLTYRGDAVVLDSDSLYATPFNVTVGTNEGTLVFKTINNKYLHVLSNSSDYLGTSPSNVTDTPTFFNDLTLSKFPVLDDSLSTFGKLSIMGTLGVSSDFSVSTNDFAMVDFTKKEGYSVKAESLQFTDDKSGAFCFIPTDMPVEEVDTKYNIVPSEVVTFDNPLSLNFEVDAEVSVVEGGKALLIGEDGSVLSEIQITASDNKNQFDIQLPEIPNGKYSIRIPAHTFNYLQGGVMVTSKEISASFVVKISTPAVCVFHEDFNNGIPSTFTLYDFDKSPADANLNFAPMSWGVIADPEDAHNQIAAAASWLTGKVQANDWMLTPVITLPEDAENCNLYWRSRSAYDTYHDSYKVYVNDNPVEGGEFNLEDWTILEDYPIDMNPATWKFRSHDLSAYAGKDVQIAFVQNSLDCWMIYIDDIYVGNETCLDAGYIHLENDPIAYNEKGEVKFSVKAGIRDEIKNFQVRLKTSEGIVTEQFDSIIAPSKSALFVMDQTVNGVGGSMKDYSVELFVNGLPVSSDNSHFVFAVPLDVDSVGDMAIGRRVVGEMIMDRESPFAPNGYEADVVAMTNYPETMITLNYHSGLSDNDNNQVTLIQAYADKLASAKGMVYARDICVDNSLFGDAYYELDSLYNINCVKPALVKVDMDDCVCTVDSVKLNATVSFALSSSQMECSYMFAVVEDKISSTFFNRYASGKYGAFLNYTSYDQYVDCEFNNVVRAISDVVPVSKAYEAGDSVSLSFALPLKQLADYSNLVNLKAVLLVKNKATGEILNANRCHFTYTGDFEPDGIVSHRVNEPVLSNNTLTLGEPALVSVCDLSGRVLFNQKVDSNLDLTTVAKNQIVVLKVLGTEPWTMKVFVK